MNKLAVAIVCFTIASLLLVGIVEAAEFTVDKNSLLHFGGATVTAMTVDVLMYENKVAKKPRKVATFVMVFCAVSAKEFVMDATPDYGDILFNGLGAMAGIAVAENFMIVPTNNGVAVAGRW